MLESLTKVLPKCIIEPLQERLNLDKLYEVRLRAGQAVTINYGGKLYFLSPQGICQLRQRAIEVDVAMVTEVVVRATDYSLYAVNDQLKTGYLTLQGGVRIGIAGEVVYGEQGEVKTLKNFSSVNIRVPHEVLGAGDSVYKSCLEVAIFNTLIVSPPGAGKTTILRDIARRLSERTPPCNVLVVDERNELAASFKGVSQTNIGTHTDVFANAAKQFAFTAGIRALAPDIIITDELATFVDASSVEYAASAGVHIIASCHGRSVEDIKIKSGFKNLVQNRIFKRFVVLSSREGPGTIEGVYDENFVSLG